MNSLAQRISYLEAEIDELEEKLAFHDNCGRHCTTCALTTHHLNNKRAERLELESLQDDRSHELMENDL